MKKIITLLSSFLLSTSMAYADVEKEVTGEGATKELAKQAALTEAVRQHFGVAIKSASVSEFSDNGEEITDSFANNKIQAFEGFVKSYEIIDISKTDTGYEATLLVDMYVDKKKEEMDKISNRPTIALSFKGLKSEQFKSSVESYLVGGRKYAVLQSPEESKFILEVSIKNAYTKKNVKEKHVKLTGETKKTTTYKSLFEIKYKVINRYTNAVVASDIQRTTSSSNNLNLLIEKYASEKLYKDVNEAIAPVRVVSFDGKYVIMGEGGKNIKENSYYDVFKLGEEIIDPYNGESLGRSETKIGTVKVVKVLPKFSQAIVVSGSIEDISKFDILRKSQSKKKSQPKSKVKENKEEDSVGGIIL